MSRFFIAFFALLTLNTMGQTTHDFAQKDGQTLRLDLYKPSGDVNKNTCVVYVFGGGFVTGSRTEEQNVRFFKDLATREYSVVAIDYRLGLQGVKNVGALNFRPVFRAVEMATEDLLSATDYMVANHVQLGIDTSRMVLVGSSAGAITVLQADHRMANMAGSFRYKGVISMAGALFSTAGRPVYATPPCPTLFYHGTADKVVVYKKIQILKLGMFGTDALVKIFDKHDYPYMAVRYVDAKHEVAEFPRFYAQDEVCQAIDAMVEGRFTNELDILVKDKQAAEQFKSDLKRKDLYNGN